MGTDNSFIFSRISILPFHSSWRRDAGHKGSTRKDLKLDGRYFPIDKIRIKSVMPGPGNNAIVEAQVENGLQIYENKVRLAGYRYPLWCRAMGKPGSEMKTAYNREKTSKAQTDLSNLKTAIEAYRSQRGRLSRHKISSSSLTHWLRFLCPT